MVDKEMLRKAQLKMVDILVEIDKVCAKHDIKYWLAYGTLLGAVRHKGFIPWDDDCDIYMMREDHDRFVKIAAKELPANLFVQTPETDPKYSRGMTKVRMNGTKLVEFDESENEGYHQGVYVDIFICDYHHPLMISIMKNIEVINEWKYKRKQYPKGSFKRVAIQLAVVLPYIFYSTTMKILKAVSTFVRKDSSLKYIGVEVDGCDMKFFQKEELFPLKRDIAFEDKYFPVPNDSDSVLTKLYGDYMKLPKPEDRLWHAKKIEVN